MCSESWVNSGNARGGQFWASSKTFSLLLGAVGVVGAVLNLVQLQCRSPHRTGLLVVAEGKVRVADSIEGVGLPVGMAEVEIKGEGLLVVVDGDGVVGNAAEAV
jgi:hypothetical protein